MPVARIDFDGPVVTIWIERLITKARIDFDGPVDNIWVERLITTAQNLIFRVFTHLAHGNYGDLEKVFAVPLKTIRTCGLSTRNRKKTYIESYAMMKSPDPLYR
jgi:hypothetical protein